ncbi:hypothetical protein ACQKWADRAFT_303903 [Trichoderma austrokoningii]
MEYRLTEYWTCTRVNCCGGDWRRRRAGNDIRVQSASYSVLVICWGLPSPVTAAVTSLLVLLDAGCYCWVLPLASTAPVVYYKIRLSSCTLLIIVLIQLAQKQHKAPCLCMMHLVCQLAPRIMNTLL